VARPGSAAGMAAVSGPVGTAGVGPAPLDTAETSPAGPRWPAQDLHWAHRRVPSLGPLTRTWKTSYGGRRDSDNWLAGRALTLSCLTALNAHRSQPFGADGMSSMEMTSAMRLDGR